MNNSVLFILLLVSLFSSCKKEDEQPSEIIFLPLTQHIGWKTIDFKDDLTIHVPQDYTGGLVAGIEGAIFNAYNGDHTVRLLDFHCTPLFCYSFGDTLSDPSQNLLSIDDYYYHEAVLDIRQDLCDDLITIGILFYRKEEPRLGKFYWLKDGLFRQSLSLYYDSLHQQEIEQILQSIQR